MKCKDHQTINAFPKDSKVVSGSLTIPEMNYRQQQLVYRNKIIHSTSDWLMPFSPSTSASWKNMQSYNSHTTKFKEWAAEEGKKHTALFPLKEIQRWEMLALQRLCMCLCILVCIFHLSQLYMEITVLCGLHGSAAYSVWFRGLWGQTERQTDSNTNSEAPLMYWGASRGPQRENERV